MQALQAQNLMWAPAGVTFSMFFVNIAFNSILVSTYGFTGAAYAQSASRIAQFLLLAGAALPDPGFSRDAEQWMHCALSAAQDSIQFNSVSIAMQYLAKPTRALLSEVPSCLWRCWSPQRRFQDWMLAGHVLTFGRSCLSFEREVLAEEYPPENEASTGKLIRQALEEDGSAHKARLTASAIL